MANLELPRQDSGRFFAMDRSSKYFEPGSGIMPNATGVPID